MVLLSLWLIPGDAEIAEIPENYVPQSHEYFSVSTLLYITVCQYVFNAVGSALQE